MDEGRKRVAVLVAAHCAPKVLKMTLGTWLSAYDGSYGAEVFVSVHSNYHHYHPGLAEVEAMEPAVRLVKVDEPNWGRYPPGTVESMMRYSEAHMLSVLALMREAAARGGFTHVAVLDHDLVFKKDFVGWAVRRGKDVVCSLLGDRREDAAVDTGLCGRLVFAPKPSVWHAVLSDRVLVKVLARPEMVLPGPKDGRCFDSMSRMYEAAPAWGLSVEPVPEAEAARMVEHLWSMSFNYGPCQVSYGVYSAKLAEVERRYDEMFPAGIGGLLARLGR